MSAVTILIYGRSGAGKSSQVGVLAEDVFKRTGKRTRLATADRGGVDTIAPYISLGIIELVEIGTSDPWVFAHKTAKGFIKRDGKWVLDTKLNEGIGLYAFESVHSIAKLMKLDMERKAALGVNIGGDQNSTFEASSDGEKIKIGSTKGYQKFAIPQSRIQEEMMESQKLQAEYVLWTAGVDKDDDDTSSGKIVGPSSIGKALTGSLPMDSNYTFRMDVIPAQGNNQERHLMYLGSHTDVNAGNALALGNIRRPLDSGPMKTNIIEPADIVLALKMVRDDAARTATDAIRKRLGIKA